MTLKTLSERDARTDGDRVRGLAFKRTRKSGEAFDCPREGSEMAARCVARDGGPAVASMAGVWACVGCGHSVQSLLTDEKQLHGATRPLW